MERRLRKLAETAGAHQGERDVIARYSAAIEAETAAADRNAGRNRLYLIICPEIAGGGQRLFDDGLPASKWRLARQETGELGEVAMVYDRARLQGFNRGGRRSRLWVKCDHGPTMASGAADISPVRVQKSAWDRRQA
jgi:hypothetical protein